MKRVLLTVCVLLLASISTSRLSAELVSASTARAAIENSEAGNTIQSSLVAQGMSTVAAMDMVDKMSVEEVSYFGEQGERNQVGESVGGFIIFVLVVVLLVFLIIYIADQV